MEDAVDFDSGTGQSDKLFNRSSLPQGIGAEPAKISPVAWDNLPAPAPGKSRLATQAPGTSEKGSGLVDLSALREQLNKDKPATAPKPAAAPVRTPARLAVSAKAGGESGLIDVNALREAVAEQEAKAEAKPTRADDAEGVPSFGGQGVGEVAAANDAPTSEPVAAGSSAKMLYIIVGLLLAMLGMLGYLATR